MTVALGVISNNSGGKTRVVALSPKEGFANSVHVRDFDTFEEAMGFVESRGSIQLEHGKWVTYNRNADVNVFKTIIKLTDAKFRLHRMASVSEHDSYLKGLLEGIDIAIEVLAEASEGKKR